MLTRSQGVSGVCCMGWEGGNIYVEAGGLSLKLSAIAQGHLEMMQSRCCDTVIVDGGSRPSQA